MEGFCILTMCLCVYTHTKTIQTNKLVVYQHVLEQYLFSCAAKALCVCEEVVLANTVDFFVRVLLLFSLGDWFKEQAYFIFC